MATPIYTNNPVDIYSIEPVELIGQYESSRSAEKHFCKRVMKNGSQGYVLNCLNGATKFFKDDSGKKLIAFNSGTPLDKVQNIIKQRRISAQIKKLNPKNYFKPTTVAEITKIDIAREKRRIKNGTTTVVKKPKKDKIGSQNSFREICIAIEYILSHTDHLDLPLVSDDLSEHLVKKFPNFNLSKFTYLKKEKLISDRKIKVEKIGGRNYYSLF